MRAACMKYIASLGLNISFAEEDVCDNIGEAYEDLIKDE